MLGFLRGKKRKPVIFLKNPDGTFAGSKQIYPEDPPVRTPEIQENDRVLANKMLRQTQADMKAGLEFAKTLREEGLNQLTDQAKFNELIADYAGEGEGDSSFEKLALTVIEEAMKQKGKQPEQPGQPGQPAQAAQEPAPQKPEPYYVLSNSEKKLVDKFAEKVPEILLKIPTDKLVASIEYLKEKYKNKAEPEPKQEQEVCEESHGK